MPAIRWRLAVIKKDAEILRCSNYHRAEPAYEFNMLPQSVRLDGSVLLVHRFTANLSARCATR